MYGIAQKLKEGARQSGLRGLWAGVIRARRAVPLHPLRILVVAVLLVYRGHDA